MRTQVLVASILLLSVLVGCGGSEAPHSPASPETAPGDVGSTTPARTEWGYIELPDGEKLRYTLWLPEGEGPFPTLMQYEGYNAGSFPDSSNAIFAPRMLSKGYAILGVSLRGSACSGGVWEVFNVQQAEDGAYAVEWAAQQPWSNSRVALFGLSYGGIMQLWVASMNPPHLVAAAPAAPVADTYRDVAFPGGLPNITFPPAWGAILNVSWNNAAIDAAQLGDFTCLEHHATHIVPNNLNTVAREMIEHPHDGPWHFDHSPINWVQNIRVPILAQLSWQDNETGPRASYWYERLSPDTTWVTLLNGHHLMGAFSEPYLDQLEAFYDYHVKGIDNGFGTSPRVQIWHETSVGDWTPRSVTYKDRLPVSVEERALYLASDGSMTRERSNSGAPSSTSYIYPLPSPPVVDGSSNNIENPRINTWSVSPYVAIGRAVFTTPPLGQTFTHFNSASADLWISTIARDVDIQVTITEVRPDGREMYVQRGWLRASHRALDENRSTTLRPYHLHTVDSLVNMPPGVPQLLRVEMLPFTHTFRAESSIRMYVEQPSLTGLWDFLTVITPQVVSVHHDKNHPSRLVLGSLADAVVEPTLPSCDNVHSQACRVNLLAQPGGQLDIVH